MFDKDSVNKELLNLYETKLSSLKCMYDQLNRSNICDFSNPLLLKSDDDYFKAKKRIMFIGQETRDGWYRDEIDTVKDNSDILELQKRYQKFINDGCCPGSFWNFVLEVNKAINGSLLGFSWNNVLKFGKEEGSGRPGNEVTELENNNFNVLKEEIEILKPDVIVFLSGPNYDQDIKNHFGDFEIIQNYDQCFDELKIDGISCDTAYRMYHPGYQNRLGYEKKEQYKNTLIQLLR